MEKRPPLLRTVEHLHHAISIVCINYSVDAGTAIRRDPHYNVSDISATR